MTTQNAHRDFHFIGRESEIARYKDWLNDPKERRILYFHDAFADDAKKGGIGKTWLLQQCKELTQRDYPDKTVVTADFFNVQDRNGVVIAERIITQLKLTHPTWYPSASEAILAEYRESSRNASDDRTLQKRLANAIASDLSALDEQLQKTGRYLLLFYDQGVTVKRKKSAAGQQQEGVVN